MRWFQGLWPVWNCILYCGRPPLSPSPLIGCSVMNMQIAPCVLFFLNVPCSRQAEAKSCASHGLGSKGGSGGWCLRGKPQPQPLPGPIGTWWKEANSAAQPLQRQLILQFETRQGGKKKGKGERRAAATTTGRTHTHMHRDQPCWKKRAQPLLDPVQLSNSSALQLKEEGRLEKRRRRRGLLTAFADFCLCYPPTPNTSSSQDLFFPLLKNLLPRFFFFALKTHTHKKPE